MNTEFSPFESCNMGAVVSERDNILGRLPEWKREHGNLSLKHVRRVNKFIAWQEKRIIRAWSAGNGDKAYKIWLALFKTSFAYQLIVYHRACRGWYFNINQSDARGYLNEAINTIRRHEFSILVHRFYIQKPNGKWRPIGAPTLTSKMIAKVFSDMMKLAYGSESDFQHGFTPGKGVHTALMQIWKNLEQGRNHIYEFDLKGWFNKVRPVWVIAQLAKSSSFLANQFAYLIYNTEIRFKELKSELELVLLGQVKDLYLIGKQGMTQGVPYSPVAANLALESVSNRPKGLVMYADDGVVMSEEEASSYDWLDHIKLVGAELAPEKSGITGEVFSFLGVKIDLKNNEFISGDRTFHWNDFEPSTEDALRTWLSKINNKYREQPEVGWTWEISEDSYINCLRNDLSWAMWSKAILYSLWNAKPYKGFRFFIKGGLQDVQSSSSRCLELLLRDRGHLRLAKIRQGFGESRRMYLTKNRSNCIENTAIEYSPAGTKEIIKDKLWSIMETYYIDYQPYE